MSLDKYREKRNFEQTSEPEGKKQTQNKEHIFVVQRHAATRLHYDFRLEIEGVLKSWAIPKGPSLNPSDKRLAVKVEDHPYDYRTFEGKIPEGNYGAGQVEIWDEGTYAPMKKIEGKTNEEVLLDEHNNGSLKIILNGEKLKGEFALFKLHSSKQENNWLLVKHKDEFAVDAAYDAEEHTPAESKVTKVAQKRYKNYKTPQFKISDSKPDLKSSTKASTTAEIIKPMLAATGNGAFDSDEWLFEIKWDGYRGIADLTSDNLLLYSRSGISFAEKYPMIVEHLKLQENQMILDGEIVVFDQKGKPNFQMLQHFAENQNRKITYQVFDILQLNGYSTVDLPLIQRKELLREALKETPHIKYCDHVENDGENFYKVILSESLEGMMAKRKNSIYQIGSRSDSWLKIKNHKTEEAVIAGYTQPRGSRKYFGALILGKFENNRLIYAAHVGTGFSEKLLHEIYEKMQPLVATKNPFEEMPPVNEAPVWIDPKIVCTIKYIEITESGVFRHPVFVGIREDLNVSDFSKEETNKTGSVQKQKPEKTKSEIMPKMEFTNLDKLYWKKEKITKGDLIDYYLSISEYLLPHLRDRAQSLHRFPNGIESKGFYHKDAGKDAPSWVETVQITPESNDKEISYIVCNNKETLGYLINLGCIDLNPWSNRILLPDNPDYIIIDLDPSPKNTFSDVVKVAQTVKKILDRGKIKAFCKTSGSTGIHILIPTKAKYSYEQVRDFAHLIMQMAQKQLLDLTTLERALDNRNGKIYLDYLQNKVVQTIASVYSVRPKPDATVSMPLEWNELDENLSIKDFTIHNALERIQEKGELFSTIFDEEFEMSKAIDLFGNEE